MRGRRAAAAAEEPEPVKALTILGETREGEREREGDGAGGKKVEADEGARFLCRSRRVWGGRGRRQSREVFKKNKKKNTHLK